MKRFWREVTVVAVEAGEAGAGGFAIRLDRRPLRTPAEAPCLLPTRALAEAVAAEWAAVEQLRNRKRFPWEAWRALVQKWAFQRGMFKQRLVPSRVHRCSRPPPVSWVHRRR